MHEGLESTGTGAHHVIMLLPSNRATIYIFGDLSCPHFLVCSTTVEDEIGRLDRLL